MLKHIAVATTALLTQQAAAQTLPPSPCANYARMADTQAPIARDLAREAAAIGSGGIPVTEAEIQPTFDRLQAAANQAQKSLEALATAWEDVQIETSRCRVLANRNK